METIKLNNGMVTAYQTREEITQLFLSETRHTKIPDYLNSLLNPESRNGKYIKEVIKLCPKNNTRHFFAMLWHIKLDNCDSWGGSTLSPFPFHFTNTILQMLFIEYYDTRRNMPEIEDLRKNIKRGTTIYHSINGELRCRQVNSAKLELGYNLNMCVQVDDLPNLLHFKHTPNTTDALEDKSNAMFTNKHLAIEHTRQYLNEKLEKKRKEEHRIITKMQKLNLLECVKEKNDT